MRLRYRVAKGTLRHRPPQFRLVRPIYMEAQPVRPPSLFEQVSEQLAELICQQAGCSDSLPPERKLAEELGVSRSVVREAIKRLELQGLLEVRQGSGIRIVNQLHRPLNGSLSLLIPDTTERLRQLHETRIALEPEAARLAALRATPEQLEELREIQSRLEQASDNAEAISIDLEFHHALAEASGNLMFRLILDSLGDISRESRQRTIGRIGKEKAIHHHREIIEAIVVSDPDAADEAMIHHLKEARRDMDIDT